MSWSYSISASWLKCWMSCPFKRPICNPKTCCFSFTPLYICMVRTFILCVFWLFFSNFWLFAKQLFNSESSVYIRMDLFFTFGIYNLEPCKSKHKHSPQNHNDAQLTNCLQRINLSLQQARTLEATRYFDIKLSPSEAKSLSAGICGSTLLSPHSWGALHWCSASMALVHPSWNRSGIHGFFASIIDDSTIFHELQGWQGKTKGKNSCRFRPLQHTGQLNGPALQGFWRFCGAPFWLNLKTVVPCSGNGTVIPDFVWHATLAGVRITYSTTAWLHPFRSPISACKPCKGVFLPLEGTRLVRTCRTPWWIHCLSPPRTFHLRTPRLLPRTSPQASPETCINSSTKDEIRSPSLLWHHYWHPPLVFSSISIGKIFDLYPAANTKKCHPTYSKMFPMCILIIWIHTTWYHMYVSMLFPCLVDFWSSSCVKPWTFRPSFHLLPPNFPLKPLEYVVFGPWNVQWQPQSNWLSLTVFPTGFNRTAKPPTFFFVWNHFAVPPLSQMWKK